MRRRCFLIRAVGTCALWPAIRGAAAAAPEPLGKTYALLIGIEDYDDPTINPVRFAINDVQDMAAKLKSKFGFIKLPAFDRTNPANQLVVLTSADTEVNRRPLHNIVIRKFKELALALGANDRLIFIWTGHGYETEGRTYLCTVNADLNSRETLDVTTVPLSTLEGITRRLQTRKVIFLIDACRDDPRAGSGESDNLRTPDQSRSFGVAAGNPLAADSESAILFACRERQRAWPDPDYQHGIFTRYLLEALDNVPSLSVQDIIEYVAPRVAERSRQLQRPIQKPELVARGGGRIFLVPPPATDAAASEVNTRAELRVLVTPGSATIIIAGVPGSRYVTQLLDTKTATVPVRVSAPGYQGKLIEATIERGKTLSLPVTLDKVAVAVATIKKLEPSRRPIKPAPVPARAARIKLVEPLWTRAVKALPWATDGSDHWPWLFQADTAMHGALNPDLVRQAKQIAGTITDSQHKVYALASIAKAQAKAGNIAGAKQTFQKAKQSAQTITGIDNKAITLADIAKAQAKAGDITGARQTAETITKTIHQGDAFDSIVWNQAKVGDIAGAKQTVQTLNWDRKANAFFSISEAQAQAGDIAGAKQTFQQAKEAFQQAKQRIGDLPYFFLSWFGSEEQALSSISVAQAKAGDITGAKQTAETIPTSHDKARALAFITEIQVKAGDVTSANQTFQQARQIAETITNSFYKAYALASISVAQAKAGDITEARKTAEIITNGSFKSRALVSIGEAQANAGDITSAKQTFQQAFQQAKQNAQADLVSIARAQAKAGDITGARQTAHTIAGSSDKAAALVCMAEAQAKAGDITSASRTVNSISIARSKIEALCRCILAVVAPEQLESENE